MTHDSAERPRVLITMGDVAGIGPEVVARTCVDPNVSQQCRPLVVGEPTILERALREIGSAARVRLVDGPCTLEETAGVDILCWNPLAEQQSAALRAVKVGTLDGRAGRAAYEWLVAAARAALAGSVAAIVTAPLNKAALHLAGLDYPGHTEILADCCGTPNHAMMLFVPPGEIVRSPHGLGVAHVTLHTSVASVPGLLSVDGIGEKIHLVDDFLRQVGVEQPRIGVCALNPHGGEAGLFGDEEQRLIVPAVTRAIADRLAVEGPVPADALFRRALAGEFDGVVAMYHDQGHIPIKLVARDAAVNVTLGLPIVRTSPSHGTAFDIAGRGLASAQGMNEAIRVAVALSSKRSAVAQTVAGPRAH
ncbi:MAG TPA: 4-hydroxythreonine-4-phosphate dehydrogenase PdxA [Planctomycetaceae bacterium]|nr:4-hydroxythreonine-4-phosphate dehydrogenase PdxA [Planctomycetaceae bacterium]